MTQRRARCSAFGWGDTAALLAETSVTVAVKKASRKHRKVLGPQVCQAEVYTSGVVTERTVSSG